MSGKLIFSDPHQLCVLYLCVSPAGGTAAAADP